MDAKLVARIFTPTTDAGRWEAGTAYPIAKNLLITVRHVLYPKQRDGTKPREVEWPDYKDPSGKVFCRNISDIVFEDEETDIAIVACETPIEAVSTINLSEHAPMVNDGWESWGYPKGGVDPKGKQEKTPGKGTFFSVDTDNHKLHLETHGDAVTKELWKGMSGAPVFSLKTHKLVAVIASTPESFNERLYATSIPYLLKAKTGFNKAIHYSDTQIATGLLPELKMGSEFRDFLYQEIVNEFNRPEAKWLKEQLADSFNHDKTAGNLEELITNSLLSNQIVDKAIGDLTVAASDCISLTGCRFREVGDKLDKVREIAEQILGWLVLASIDENKISQILPKCEKRKSYYFSLGVNSIAGVEIVLSRRFDRKVTWKSEDKNNAYPKSPYRISLDNSLLKWDDKETLRKILIEIWNQVFPTLEAEKREGDKLDQGEIEFLNETLEELRNFPRKKRHHYIAFKLSEASPTFIENIYEQLLNLLPQMTVVQFGVEGEAENLFVMPEARITAKISQFYREINS